MHRTHGHLLPNLLPGFVGIEVLQPQTGPEEMEAAGPHPTNFMNGPGYGTKRWEPTSNANLYLIRQPWTSFSLILKAH